MKILSLILTAVIVQRSLNLTRSNLVQSYKIQKNYSSLAQTSAKPQLHKNEQKRILEPHAPKSNILNARQSEPHTPKCYSSKVESPQTNTPKCHYRDDNGSQVHEPQVQGKLKNSKPYKNPDTLPSFNLDNLHRAMDIIKRKNPGNQLKF